MCTLSRKATSSSHATGFWKSVLAGLMHDNKIGILPAALSQASLDRKIAWRADPHPINRRPQQQFEVAIVESQ